MVLSLDTVPEHRVFVQCPARLEPMHAVHEDKALAIAPEQDGGRLPSTSPATLPACDFKHVFSSSS
jgi:hypothetical protein